MNEVVSLIDAAHQAHQSSQFALAEQRYRAILTAHPEQPDTLFLLSILLSDPSPEEALDLAQRAVIGSATAACLGVLRGDILDHCASLLVKLGRSDTTVLELLNQASELDPGNAERQLRIADACQRLGRLGEARAALGQYLALCPLDNDVIVREARVSVQLGDASAAAAALFTVIQREPGHFAAAINLGYVLTHLERHNEAVDWFRRATELRPEVIDAWIGLGDGLHKLSRLDEAVQAYERAGALAPGDTRVEHGINEANLRRVPRWHFGMLNDRRRNEVYDRAITRAVARFQTEGKPCFTLDIGAGSGLLSMMAARAGAAEVWACEMVKPVAEAAREIVAKNGYSDRITIHPVRSTGLRVGGELPRRANLLVTEIFDAGLLGEYALPVLAHAREQLLEHDAVVVPRSATLWVMPIQSTEIHQAFIADNSNACGLDIEYFNAFANKNGIDAMTLNRYDYQALAEPQCVLDFDFSASVPDRRKNFVVAPGGDGLIHAWVFWFKLQLDDVDEFDSGPFQPGSHWKQAVQIEPVPVSVARNVPLAVQVAQSQTQIRFSILPSAASAMPNRP